MTLNKFSMVGSSLAVLWLLHPISTPPVPRDNVLPEPVWVAESVPSMSIGVSKNTKGTGTQDKGAASV